MTLSYGRYFWRKDMISENKTRIKRVEPRKIIGSATVVDGPLNIRAAASLNAAIVGEAKKGEHFNVTIGSTDDFTAIIDKDEVRYAMTKYLSVTQNA